MLHDSILTKQERPKLIVHFRPHSPSANTPRFTNLKYLRLIEKKKAAIPTFMNKTIRWQQRFNNFENAFLFLEEGLQKDSLDRLQEAGIIQSFEFTFELSWKTLKDFLESMGTTLAYPRDVIKEAFNTEIIKDGHLWIEMLDKRNILSHTYNRQQLQMLFS